MYEEKKRFQNKIAESRFSLAVTAILCLLIWIVGGLAITSSGWDMDSIITQPTSIWSNPVLITLPCLILSTYLMVELNNANILIRIFSRMVSCTFLIMMTMATFQYTNINAAIVTLCTVIAYTTAFHSYQDSQSAGWVYYSFLSIGIASIFFIQIVFFLPLMWFLLASKLYALSIRSFCASLLGLVTPYWFLVGYDAATGQMDAFISHFTAIAEFSPLFDYSMLSIQQFVTGGFIILCALIGTIHYLRTRQHDRIRTQMFYEIFVINNAATILFMILQPQHFQLLLGIAITNTAPLIAHFIALTQTKWTNLLSELLLLLTLFITIINLWELSLNF